MADICSIFTSLQKKLQRSDLIISDVLTCRDITLQKLSLMTDAPYPGGEEEKLLQLLSKFEMLGIRFRNFSFDKDALMR